MLGPLLSQSGLTGLKMTTVRNCIPRLLLASPGNKKQDKVKNGHFQSEKKFGMCVRSSTDDWAMTHLLFIEMLLNFGQITIRDSELCFVFLRRRRTERM